MVIGTIVGVVLSLLVGALGLFVGGQLVHGGERTVSHALWTAVGGSLVWTVLAWVPILGPFVLAPLAWLGVVRWRYPGSWSETIAVAVVAWLTAMAGVLVLTALGLPAVDVVGIPLV
jgi:hypothetical protein